MSFSGTFGRGGAAFARVALDAAAALRGAPLRVIGKRQGQFAHWRDFEHEAVEAVAAGKARPNANEQPAVIAHAGESSPEGMERVKGIEPSYSAWKAAALPLSYTRTTVILCQSARRLAMGAQTMHFPFDSEAGRH